MYKRFIFRYYDVLIKTQRDDNEGFVDVSHSRDLNVHVVKTGKSVFMLN
jgi:C4-type Zn-finger protein